MPRTAGIRGPARNVAPCENSCDGEETRCSERARQVCSDGDLDGCLDWVALPCAKGQACSKGRCLAEKPAMVFVPEGSYRMGSAREDLDKALALCRVRGYGCEASWWKTEQPAHWVSVSGFWIDKTEVTQAAYAECVRAGACHALDPKTCRGWDPHTGQWAKGAVDQSFLGPQRPAVCATRDEARAFCTWAGKRLPTEAEWEKAARGVDGRLYPWGNERVDGTRANVCDKRCGEVAVKGWRVEPDLDDRFVTLADVGSYPAGASPYGALDMSGNVWEWVADRYGESYYSESARQDPLGPEDGEQFVIRGGAWSNEPDSLRSAYRYEMRSDARLVTIGWRCAYP